MASDSTTAAIVQALLAPNGLVPHFQPSAPAAAAPAPAPTFLGMLPPPNARPGGVIQTIDPGVTWGGHDTNAIQPNTLMQNYFTKPIADQEDL